MSANKHQAKYADAAKRLAVIDEEEAAIRGKLEAQKFEAKTALTKLANERSDICDRVRTGQVATLFDDEE